MSTVRRTTTGGPPKSGSRPLCNKHFLDSTTIERCLKYANEGKGPPDDVEQVVEGLLLMKEMSPISDLLKKASRSSSPGLAMEMDLHIGTSMVTMTLIRLEM